MSPEYQCTVPFLTRREVRAADISFFVDAAGTANLGFGCCYGNCWAQGAWCDTSLFSHNFNPNIALLELHAIVMAVEIWSHEIQGSELLLCSDNGATCYWINKMCSDIPAAMALLHHLTLHCLFFQIHVSAQHLSSSANRKSNLVSHFCMAELFHEFPEMKRRPEPLLLLLLPLTWSQEEMLPLCKN